MDNKRLSWTRKYNNNQFIIASRAYFQQPPTCTRVNNLVHIAMWFNTNIHICIWLTPIVHIVMWLTPKGFTRVNNLVHIAMWLTPMESWYWSCFARERGLVNRSATFRSVCIFQISMSFPRCSYHALFGAIPNNCSTWSYSKLLLHYMYPVSLLRAIRIGVKLAST